MTLVRPTITGRSVAFATPWFEVVAKQFAGESSPHYTVTPPDYTTVVATGADGRVLLVRQYRPVVEDFTIELPSGLVDPGETPEASARRELVEETGHEAGDMTLLGALVPDVGRLGNQMYCFAAKNVRPVSPAPRIEDGLEVVWWTRDELVAALRDTRFGHALNYAALLLAHLQGFVDVR